MKANWCVKYYLAVAVLALTTLIGQGLASAQDCVVTWFPVVSDDLITYHLYQAATPELVRTLPSHRSSVIKGKMSSVNREMLEISCKDAGLKNGDWFTITAGLKGRHGPKNQPLKIDMRTLDLVFQCVTMRDEQGRIWGEPMCTPRVGE